MTKKIHRSRYGRRRSKKTRRGLRKFDSTEASHWWRLTYYVYDSEKNETEPRQHEFYYQKRGRPPYKVLLSKAATEFLRRQKEGFSPTKFVFVRVSKRVASMRLGPRKRS